MVYMLLAVWKRDSVLGSECRGVYQECATPRHRSGKVGFDHT